MCVRERHMSVSFQFAAELCAHSGPQYGVQFLITIMARTVLETFTHASVIHLAVTSSCA